ncbi:MAG: 5-oxoprolinase subunit PxpB [bacterium]|nr:5-oxoprolinase subunit PxpB [bacterium]
MNTVWPRVAPAGDLGLLVEFAPDLSPKAIARVHGARRLLEDLPGVVETVPGLRSVLVAYDPSAVSFDEIAGRAEAVARAAQPVPAAEGVLVEIPVVYGGTAGPDLEAAALACGVRQSEVIEIHSGTEYLVYMLGFAPGFPYLGLLAPQLRLPRRPTPRVRVPAGSVAVADAFSGIYPQETAGGWHLLGRTPLRLFDPSRARPCLLQPGDRVRFVPIPNGSAAWEAAEPDAKSSGVTPIRAFGRPVFEVLEPGLMTTVQDRGRMGWRRFGVPSSGALDRPALDAVNGVLGNLPGAAALELTFPGPRLRVLSEAEVAVAGADITALVNRTALDPGEPVRVHPGDLLEFEPPRQGQWLYLGVAGGVEVPPLLGSRSAYARGGPLGRALRAGDVLGLGEISSARRRTRRPGDSLITRNGPVRVVLGPQAGTFTAEALAAFLGRAYKATAQRDRSGTRLAGSILGHQGSAEIMSDGLLPGAIQVPADGQPLVVLADGPTTGGYPKIAWVIAPDLCRVAQAGPGAELRFEAVTVEAAHAVIREHAGWRAARCSQIGRGTQCSSDACHA